MSLFSINSRDYCVAGIVRKRIAINTSSLRLLNFDEIRKSFTPARVKFSRSSRRTILHFLFTKFEMTNDIYRPRWWMDWSINQPAARGNDISYFLLSSLSLSRELVHLRARGSNFLSPSCVCINNYRVIVVFPPISEYIAASIYPPKRQLYRKVGHVHIPKNSVFRFPLLRGMYTKLYPLYSFATGSLTLFRQSIIGVISARKVPTVIYAKTSYAIVINLA